jgi:hypothetical protein
MNIPHPPADGMPNPGRRPQEEDEVQPPGRRPREHAGGNVSSLDPSLGLPRVASRAESMSQRHNMAPISVQEVTGSMWRVGSDLLLSQGEFTAIT